MIKSFSLSGPLPDAEPHTQFHIESYRAGLQHRSIALRREELEQTRLHTRAVVDLKDEIQALNASKGEHLKLFGDILKNQRRLLELETERNTDRVEEFEFKKEKFAKEHALAEKAFSLQAQALELQYQAHQPQSFMENA